MQNNYRFFLAYCMTIAVGVLVYTFFVYVINKEVNVNSIAQSENINDETYLPISKAEDSDIIILSSASLDSDYKANTNEADVIKEHESTSKLYIVNVDVLNLREKPNTQSRILKQYKQNEVLSIKSVDSNWGEVDSGGFVYIELLKQVSPPTLLAHRDL